MVSLIQAIDDLRHILLIYGSIKANCGVCCVAGQSEKIDF